ncbi:MAG TPA: hypothetical protein VMV89_00780 [Candidatus Paceibacterota bacterium]|nr:hypothetical protein [Candidatus Paceibacterota bacterium]
MTNFAMQSASNASFAIQRAAGAAFRPALPWWQPFVFAYLSITGWVRRPRRQQH